MLFLPTLWVWGDASNEQPWAPTVASQLENEPFPHSKHVSKVWLKTEVKRDCRGCHDYDKTGGIREPEQSCVLCHYDFPDGSKALAVEGSIKGMRTEGSPFVHGDHLKLNCAECHAPPKKRRGPPGVPNQMYVPTGLGWCVKCHDPKAANAPAARSKDDQGFQAAINENPKMRANPDAVFKHTQHLSSSELKNPKNCAACHSSLESASADIGDQVYNSASCGDCHQTKAGKSLPFGTKMRAYVSGADLSFFHADHVSKGALANNKKLRDEGCFACHELGDKEGREISDYPLKRGFDKFEQCANCHKEEGVPWRGIGGKGDEQPVAWRSDDHADLNKKNNCVGCHVAGEALAMKTSRPQRVQNRSRPALFEIRVQAHPHITGAKKSKECKTCHIAEAELIPSRIKKKKFRHGSHLGSGA